jgi:hypothetical protein
MNLMYWFVMTQEGLVGVILRKEREGVVPLESSLITKVLIGVVKH